MSQLDSPPPLSRNRDFQLLWIGSVVSVLGSRISSIAYPLLVLALDGSAAEAGLAGFAATLPHLLFQLPAGVLVDRWNRKRVLIGSDVGRLLAVGSVFVAAFWGDPTLPHILAAAFLEGSLSVFHQLAEPAAVRSLVPRAQLSAALAQVEARERGTSLLGQPLGGLLYGLGRWVPFLADSFSYLVSLVTLLLLRSDLKIAAVPERRRFGAELLTGLAWLWKKPFLLVSAFLVAGSNLLFQALVLVLLVIAENRGAEPAAIGLMLAGAGAGGVLGALAAPWLERRLRRRTVVVGINWVWAALMPLFPLVESVAVLGLLFGLMAFVGPVWNVAIQAYRLSVTPAHLVARVESATSLLAYGAIPLGSLVGGFLLEVYGGGITLWALSCWMLGLAAWATLSPAIRRAPDSESAEGEEVPRGG